MNAFLERIASWWEPHLGQREFLLARAKVKVLACGRRWGKTEACAALVASLLSEAKPAHVLIVAPTLDQARILFDRVVDFVGKVRGARSEVRGIGDPSTPGPSSPGAGGGEVATQDQSAGEPPPNLPLPLRGKGRNSDASRGAGGGETFKVKYRPFPLLQMGRHTVVARSGHLPNALRGHEATHIIVDEAAFVSEKLVKEALFPMLATTSGEMTLISTPNGFNFFQRMFEWAKRRGEGFRVEGRGEREGAGCSVFGVGCSDSEGRMAARDQSAGEPPPNLPPDVSANHASSGMSLALHLPLCGKGRNSDQTSALDVPSPSPSPDPGVPISPLSRLIRDVPDDPHEASASPERGTAPPPPAPPPPGLEEGSLDAWASTAPSAENPHVSPAFLEAQREMLSERSFDVEYGARFLESAGAVFRSAAIEECLVGGPRGEVRGSRGGEPSPPGPLPPGAGEGELVPHYVQLAWSGHGIDDPHLPVSIGIDWGRKQDWTAVLVLCGDFERAWVVESYRMQGAGFVAQAEKVAQILARYPRASVTLDSTGIGDAACEILRLAMPNRGFRQFHFDKASKQMLVERMVSQVERGALKMRPDPLLLQEMRSFVWKGGVAEGDGEHDDLVIALGLATAFLQRSSGGVRSSPARKF